LYRHARSDAIRKLTDKIPRTISNQDPLETSLDGMENIHVSYKIQCPKNRIA
jgi:hypothetical protein